MFGARVGGGRGFAFVNSTRLRHIQLALQTPRERGHPLDVSDLPQLLMLLLLSIAVS